MSGSEPTPETTDQEVARMLRRHVDRILLASAIPQNELADVAEEMDGHLYDRWQEAMATGLEPVAAARLAIEGFGEPRALGPQFTSAFHSRLYASTIGLLLTVNPAAALTEGFGRAVIVLAFGVFGQVVLAIVLAMFVAPLPAIIGIAACGYVAALSILAIKALARGQEWAVRLVQAACVIDILAAIFLMIKSGQPPALSLVTTLAFYFWVINGISLADGWQGETKPRHRAVTPLVVASMVVAFALPCGAPFMPDPTQTGPSDLSMRVTANCPQTGPWTVVADLQWTKTDALGGRLLPILNDGIGLSVGRQFGTDSSFPGDSGPWFDEDVTGGDLVDLQTGATMHGDLGPSNEWSGSPAFNVGNRRFSLDPTWMRAGHTYQTTFQLAGAAADRDAIWGGRDGRFRVRYQHLGRWKLEAVATCGHTETASPVLR